MLTDCDPPPVDDGVSTALFARAWPLAAVVGLEPSEENYAMTQLNTAGLANVKLLRAALCIPLTACVVPTMNSPFVCRSP